MAKKPNAFLAKMEAQRSHSMELQRRFTYQQCLDNMIMILHERFGFGPIRCKRAYDAFEKAFFENAKTVIEMREILTAGSSPRLASILSRGKRDSRRRCSGE